MLRIALATALLLACGEPAAPPRPDPSSARALPAGDVVGFTGAYGSHVWRGIPYAAAPVGVLRWREPRPAPRSERVREALASGSACPQFASVLGGARRGETGIVGDEDCLTLDVFAPRYERDAIPTGDARLSVLLWIHGGPTFGSAGFYDGGNLAATQDVVVVAINYRSGPFGWFHHAALRAGARSAAERSGSFALLDQVRALEWVQENIAAFGGDAARVTIFGEGFGAWSVGSLLLSPLTRGLFHRAILHSNPGWATPTPAETENWLDDPEPGAPHSSNEILATLLVRDGTAPHRAAARAHARSLSDARIEAYLRASSMEEILGAYVEEPGSYSGGYEIPVALRDGVVLPAEPPLETLARGAYARVPVLLGTTRDEKKLVQALDPEFVAWRLGLFPHALDPERYEAEAEHHARACKASSVDAPARAIRAGEGEAVYAFRFDWDEEPRIPLLYDGPLLLGAAHGLIGPFVFAHFELGPQTSFIFGGASRTGRETLAAQMMSYWVEFADAGSPGRGRRAELPEWKAWDPTEGAMLTMLLDTPAAGGLRMQRGSETVEEVIEALLADPRLADPRHRCAALAPWGCVSDTQYAAVDACRPYPRKGFPWREDQLDSR
ncbi:MAG: carboxylesterase family protein [Myxococcota bacterium]